MKKFFIVGITVAFIVALSSGMALADDEYSYEFISVEWPGDEVSNIRTYVYPGQKYEGAYNAAISTWNHEVDTPAHFNPVDQYKIDVNCVTVEEVGEEWWGVAIISHEDGEITGVHVEMNDWLFQFTSREDDFGLQKFVAKHEFGHALGLADVEYDPTVLMYESNSAYDWFGVTGPTEDDEYGVNVLYD